MGSFCLLQNVKQGCLLKMREDRLQEGNNKNTKNTWHMVVAERRACPPEKASRIASQLRLTTITLLSPHL